MLIYTDLLTGELQRLLLHCAKLYVSICCAFAGDEMIADSYELKEVEDAFFFEVEGSVSASSKHGQTASGRL